MTNYLHANQKYVLDDTVTNYDARQSGDADPTNHMTINFQIHMKMEDLLDTVQ